MSKWLYLHLLYHNALFILNILGFFRVIYGCAMKIGGGVIRAAKFSLVFSDSLLGGCPRIRYSNDYLLMGFRKNLNYPDAKLQIDQILHSFLLKLVHIGLIQSIFTYIAGFTVKFPNSGRINPVIMALAIFLKLCAAQTIENSPATFSLPRTLKPRKPLFLI